MVTATFIKAETEIKGSKKGISYHFKCGFCSTEFPLTFWNPDESVAFIKGLKMGKPTKDIVCPMCTLLSNINFN